MSPATRNQRIVPFPRHIGGGRAHPLLSAVLFELNALFPTRLGGIFVVLERIHNVVRIQASKVIVARFPASLALGTGRGDDTGADLSGPLIFFGLPEKAEEAHCGGF